MKQVKFYVDEEHYEKLRKLAEEQGLSVPAYVKNLVLKAIGELEPGIEETVKYLEERTEQLGKEIGQIGIDLARVIKRVERLEREILSRHQRAT
ncbi:MAG: ribbon-helix-helix domain-containing protein [Fervidicoccaceae archaeon]